MVYSRPFWGELSKLWNSLKTSSTAWKLLSLKDKIAVWTLIHLKGVPHQFWSLPVCVNVTKQYNYECTVQLMMWLFEHIVKVITWLWCIQRCAVPKYVTVQFNWVICFAHTLILVICITDTLVLSLFVSHIFTYSTSVHSQIHRCTNTTHRFRHIQWSVAFYSY